MVVGGVALSLLSGGFGAQSPKDVPAVEDGAPPEQLRIVALGTSLTARATWPEALSRQLAACLDRPVPVAVVAAPGETSRWGLTQIPEVLAARPDVVLVEFTANDADARDGLTLDESRRTHAEILAALRRETLGTKVILMSMNPTHGLRGLLRWRHGAYRAAYHGLAQSAPDIGYLDLDARWRQQMTPAQRRAAIPDGLHPRAEVAQMVIVPPLAATVARLFAQDCPG